MSNNQMVSINQLCKELTISRATLYRWVELGHLPAPIKIGPPSAHGKSRGRVAFRRADIEAFLASRGEAKSRD